MSNIITFFVIFAFISACGIDNEYNISSSGNLNKNIATSSEQSVDQEFLFTMNELISSPQCFTNNDYESLKKTLNGSITNVISVNGKSVLYANRDEWSIYLNNRATTYNFWTGSVTGGSQATITTYCVGDNSPVTQTGSCFKLKPDATFEHLKSAFNKKTSEVVNVNGDNVQFAERDEWTIYKDNRQTTYNFWTGKVKKDGVESDITEYCLGDNTNPVKQAGNGCFELQTNAPYEHLKATLNKDISNIVTVNTEDNVQFLYRDPWTIYNGKTTYNFWSGKVNKDGNESDITRYCNGDNSNPVKQTDNGCFELEPNASYEYLRATLNKDISNIVTVNIDDNVQFLKRDPWTIFNGKTTYNFWLGKVNRDGNESDITRYCNGDNSNPPPPPERSTRVPSERNLGSDEDVPADQPEKNNSDIKADMNIFDSFIRINCALDNNNDSGKCETITLKNSGTGSHLCFVAGSNTGNSPSVDEIQDQSISCGGQGDKTCVPVDRGAIITLRNTGSDSCSLSAVSSNGSNNTERQQRRTRSSYTYSPPKHPDYTVISKYECSDRVKREETSYIGHDDFNIATLRNLADCGGSDDYAVPLNTQHNVTIKTGSQTIELDRHFLYSIAIPNYSVTQAYKCEGDQYFRNQESLGIGISLDFKKHLQTLKERILRSKCSGKNIVFYDYLTFVSPDGAQIGISHEFIKHMPYVAPFKMGQGLPQGERIRMWIGHLRRYFEDGLKINEKKFVRIQCTSGTGNVDVYPQFRLTAQGEFSPIADNAKVPCDGNLHEVTWEANNISDESFGGLGMMLYANSEVTIEKIEISRESKREIDLDHTNVDISEHLSDENLQKVKNLTDKFKEWYHNALDYERRAANNFMNQDAILYRFSRNFHFTGDPHNSENIDRNDGCIPRIPGKSYHGEHNERCTLTWIDEGDGVVQRNDAQTNSYSPESMFITIDDLEKRDSNLSIRSAEANYQRPTDCAYFSNLSDNDKEYCTQNPQCITPIGEAIPSCGHNVSTVQKPEKFNVKVVTYKGKDYVANPCHLRLNSFIKNQENYPSVSCDLDDNLEKRAIQQLASNDLSFGDEFLLGTEKLGKAIAMLASFAYAPELSITLLSIYIAAEGVTEHESALKIIGEVLLSISSLYPPVMVVELLMAIHTSMYKVAECDMNAAYFDDRCDGAIEDLVLNLGMLAFMGKGMFKSDHTTTSLDLENGINEVGNATKEELEPLLEEYKKKSEEDDCINSNRRRGLATCPIDRDALTRNAKTDAGMLRARAIKYKDLTILGSGRNTTKGERLEQFKSFMQNEKFKFVLSLDDDIGRVEDLLRADPSIKHEIVPIEDYATLKSEQVIKILDFLKLASESAPDAKMWIHCGYGGGRTGEVLSLIKLWERSLNIELTNDFTMSEEIDALDSGEVEDDDGNDKLNVSKQVKKEITALREYEKRFNRDKEEFSVEKQIQVNTLEIFTRLLYLASIYTGPSDDFSNLLRNTFNINVPGKISELDYTEWWGFGKDDVDEATDLIKRLKERNPNQATKNTIITNLIGDVNTEYGVDDTNFTLDDDDLIEVEYKNENLKSDYTTQFELSDDGKTIQEMTIDEAFKGQASSSGNRVWLSKLWEISSRKFDDQALSDKLSSLQSSLNPDNPISVPERIKHDTVVNVISAEILGKELLDPLVTEGFLGEDEKDLYRWISSKRGTNMARWEVHRDHLIAGLESKGFQFSNGKWYKSFERVGDQTLPDLVNSLIIERGSNGNATENLINKTNSINNSQKEITGVTLGLELEEPGEGIELEEGWITVYPDLIFHVKSKQ